MLDVVWSLWIGALVGATLKLASPHQNALSWVLAALVGALGALVGVYVARIAGLPPAHRLAHHLAVGLCAAGVVVIYAVTSRALHRASRRRRTTRPTIVF